MAVENFLEVEELRKHLVLIACVLIVESFTRTNSMRPIVRVGMIAARGKRQLANATPLEPFSCYLTLSVCKALSLLGTGSCSHKAVFSGGVVSRKSVNHFQPDLSCGKNPPLA
jgi:hypothetical protein